VLLSQSTGETRLDGSNHTIIYTAEALETAETQLGRSALQLVRSSSDGGLGFREMRVLVAVGIEAHRRRTGAGGRPFNPAKVPKVIEECGGLMPVLKQVVQAIMLSVALGSNPAADEDDDDEDDQEDEPTEATPFPGPISSAG
jgi:hypothetical protein